MKAHFASVEIENELKSRQLLSPVTYASAKTVKSNPVREVRYFDTGFFIKTDRRKCHGFAGEFAMGRALQQAGLPVVEHLAYGRAEYGNFLITRACPGNAADLSHYLDNHTLSANAFQKLARFLKEFAATPYIHGDFHIGNLLFSPETESFFLVDIRAVRRKFFWERYGVRKSFFKPLFDLRGELSKAELMKLLHTVSPADDPEKIYRCGIENYAALINGDWQKRKQQLFEGYAKFVHTAGTLLVYRDAPENFPEKCDIIHDKFADCRFAAAHFLKLAGIPHLRIYAWDRQNDTIYRQKTALVSPPDDHPELPDLIWRCQLHNIAAGKDCWSMEENSGRLIFTGYHIFEKMP